MIATGPTVFTIGHSIHPIEVFVSLLNRHRITAVADVRSTPFSRQNPQFNRESLAQVLRESDIVYVPLGDELGARSKDPAHYADGKVQYERLEHSTAFKRGIARVTEAADEYRIALLCAEKDPITCHRGILIARVLTADGVTVSHVLPNGDVEEHADSVRRLVREVGLPENDMFRVWDETVAEAYRRRENDIAATTGWTSRTPTSA
jgi:uncharacterized protein (DUF488 family)